MPVLVSLHIDSLRFHRSEVRFRLPGSLPSGREVEPNRTGRRLGDDIFGPFRGEDDPKVAADRSRVST
jgi:hypothetical protein